MVAPLVAAVGRQVTQEAVTKAATEEKPAAQKSSSAAAAKTETPNKLKGPKPSPADAGTSPAAQKSSPAAAEKTEMPNKPKGPKSQSLDNKSGVLSFSKEAKTALEKTTGSFTEVAHAATKALNATAKFADTATDAVKHLTPKKP